MRETSVRERECVSYVNVICVSTETLECETSVRETSERETAVRDREVSLYVKCRNVKRRY